MKQIEIKTINSFQFKNWIRTSGSFHFFILQLKSIKWNPIKSIGCIQRILLVCLHFQFNHSNKKKRTEVYLSHSQSIFIWSMSDCRKSIKRSWTNTEKKTFSNKIEPSFTLKNLDWKLMWTNIFIYMYKNESERLLL